MFLVTTTHSNAGFDIGAMRVFDTVEEAARYLVPELRMDYQKQNYISVYGKIYDIDGTQAKLINKTRTLVLVVTEKTKQQQQQKV